MIPAAKIIALDDEIDHLNKITRSIVGNGGSCIGIHFHSEGWQLSDWHIPEPLTGIRIFFADINIIPSAATNHQNFSTLVQIIDRCISPDNGPYILVTWTANGDLSAELMDHLSERLQTAPVPAAITSLAKGEFLDAEPDVLNAAVQEIVTQCPSVGALIHWEKSVDKASGDAVQSLIKLGHSLNPESGLRTALFHLAKQAAPTGEIGENKFAAINDALFPLLSDKIQHRQPGDAELDLWNIAIPDDLNTPLDLQASAKLNTMLHVDSSEFARDVIARGSLLEINDDGPHSLQSITGLDRKATLLRAGIIDKPDTLSAEELSAIGVFGIEINPDCDHAQQKYTVHKFVLGFAIPVTVAVKTQVKARNRETPSSLEWLYQSPPIEIDETTMVMLIDLKVEFSWPLFEKDAPKPKARLREEILSKIESLLAAYRNRSGMVEFRSKLNT